MHVGVLTIELFIFNAGSLKDKRMVLKSLKDRLRNSFNCSVAEVGGHDKWQKAAVGVAAVGSDAKYLNGLLDRILDHVRGYGDLRIVDYDMEIL
jgi:uncharacterized protein